MSKILIPCLWRIWNDLFAQNKTHVLAIFFIPVILGTSGCQMSNFGDFTFLNHLPSIISVVRIPLSGFVWKLVSPSSWTLTCLQFSWTFRGVSHGDWREFASGERHGGLQLALPKAGQTSSQQFLHSYSFFSGTYLLLTAAITINSVMKWFWNGMCTMGWWASRQGLRGRAFGDMPTITWCRPTCKCVPLRSTK